MGKRVGSGEDKDVDLIKGLELSLEGLELSLEGLEGLEGLVLESTTSRILFFYFRNASQFEKTRHSPLTTHN